MKKICITFLACASIIGSAQCLYAAEQKMPLTEEIHVDDTSMIKLDGNLSHISPERIQLDSMKIDGEMIETETDREEPYTLDQLLTETAIELVDKGDTDFFQVATTLKVKADDEQDILDEEPAVTAKVKETEEKPVLDTVKEEPNASKTAAPKAEKEESEPVVEETTEPEQEAVAVSDEEKVEEEAVEETEETTEPSAEETVITMKATAYTADCEGGSGVTYTGIDLKANPDAKVIAVDPSVIPLGTEVYVEGYGHAVAADIGGAIKGNKIDVFIPNQDEAESWGVQTVDVTIMP